MSDALLTGLISIITIIISNIATFLVTKKKYYSEVDNNLIKNMQESLDFYKNLSDDNKKRLDETLERDTRLEREVEELQKTVLNIMGSICVDLTCQLRKRDLTLFDHGAKTKKEPQTK